MAKLYRNATTQEYSTEAQVDGETVLLRIHPDGRDYLEQQGIEDGNDIPAHMLMVMEENGWFTAMDGEAAGFAGDSTRDPRLVNESETGAPPSTTHDPHVDNLPSERLEPRPWMEQENVDRFKEETNPASGDTGTPARGFATTPADRENAKPLAHPEDTAFARGVWFWVLVVAAVLIVVWVLFEMM